MTLTVPCLFGLESLVADEMRRLDLKNVRAENGRVHCEGTLADIARLNVNLRCGARVLMELGSFPARDFEALFQGVYALPWENYIPRDGEFPVKGYSLNSQLHSVPACQSIVKKASAMRLGEKYGLITSSIHMPARISQEKETEIQATAQLIYRALECSGFARVDLFLTPDGRIVFNEVNTIPGFTAHSRYPNMMRSIGLEFGPLLDRLIGLAVDA